MPETNPDAEQRRSHARFHVHAGRVVDWLASAVDSMGQSLADTYAFDDSFRRGGDDLHDRIQMLVSRAQADGPLAVADHHLELWQVADEGFLLTLDPPSPPRLCSLHLAVGDLLPERTSGSVAVVAVLMAAGQVANQLLDEQARSQLTARARMSTSFIALRPGTATARPALGPPPAGSSPTPPGTGQPHRHR